ncbi:acyl carrier protein phosphodiesterase [Alteromonas lipolytica]|uniref:ACP phosphodiesterase n=1 Tax=Alteromonas lipolytica TaxID=1856405 RepID=A0A1E8FJL1_9ALTE|nr:hypothetical protein BFC17_09240 [Alteromonas lipolytica]
MNYLAHLFLSKPTADSCFGNLLGDFRRGVQLADYSEAVQAGVSNHIFVDKFTDNHELVRDARHLVSAPRRRFAGIMLDVVFDHFLLKHWDRYSAKAFSTFSEEAYACLEQRVDVMPDAMQPMIKSMLHHRWLDTYKDLSGVNRALERTADRIRFKHDFHGSIDEVHRHYAQFEQTFLAFFPHLITAVQQQQLEP